MNNDMIKNIKKLTNNHHNDVCFEYEVNVEIITSVKHLTKSGTMVYAKNTLKYAKDIKDVAIHACALNWWGWNLYNNGKEEECKAFFDAYKYISNIIYSNATEDCACDYHSYLD